MFTGIITHQAKIVDSSQWVITIQSPFNALPNIWQSIAHDWACMSVTQTNQYNNTYSFFAMQESFNKTNFWLKKIWDSFNIELCMQAWARLDWHFVTWHIDTTGKCISTSQANDWSALLTIWFNKKRNPLLLPKWSIAVNGVSLTVVEVYEDYFTLRLIPLTQQETNLWKLTAWESVNLEFDMLGKYVLKSQWITIQ